MKEYQTSTFRSQSFILHRQRSAIKEIHKLIKNQCRKYVYEWFSFSFFLGSFNFFLFCHCWKKTFLINVGWRIRPPRTSGYGDLKFASSASSRYGFGLCQISKRSRRKQQYISQSFILRRRHFTSIEVYQYEFWPQHRIWSDRSSNLCYYC